MISETMRFTDRCMRIFQHAELAALESTGVVEPIHLLVGTFHEGTGVCTELLMNYQETYDSLLEWLGQTNMDDGEQAVQCWPFHTKVSLAVKKILERSSQLMARYKQIYLNEGLVLKALFDLKDPTICSLISTEDVSSILEIVYSPRDLIVSLKEYSFPNETVSKSIIRRVTQDDFTVLRDFVEGEFGKGWLESIDNGFHETNIPIFIAIEKDQIVGFACYDVVRKKKGLFGPMGTAIDHRSLGIGYQLLHQCLKAMHEHGYAYVIIDEAGPIEFYEKACSARIIPKT
ncbi:N-acetyltransferase [Bacillus sp. J14TS2]|uniref:GNAT family N-acetyltransferase n=1 Tax=Bacillus sp. J14TS2 TaxID=2807188 RepID=UPI001B0C709B|nr:GNAT family N-acetyltransferase [Bacillus sp. J14TS2]GIN71326.1 N-acetyltransferase [Bacillus sp. J14TS2]